MSTEGLLICVYKFLFREFSLDSTGLEGYERKINVWPYGAFHPCVYKHVSPYIKRKMFRIN